MGRGGLFAAALAVAALTAAVAAPSLHYGFVYDDQAVVLERPPFWELGLGGFLHSRPHGTGRHLTAVSLDLDRLEAGNVPEPFHRTNIALAALLSALVLVLAIRIGLSLPAATVAAALFAVHPVHVDAVVWIVGRSELLAAIGILATLLVCIRPPTEERAPAAWRLALGAALLATIAIHSKENALCLPLLLVAARVFLGPRVALLPGLAGCAVAIAGWGLLVAPLVPTFKQPQFADNPLVYETIFERIPKAMAILWDYAGLLVWPHPLLLDRSWAATDPTLSGGWFALVAWLGVAGLAWGMRRSAPRAAFALAWFPLAFAVTSNVARPIGTLMAERLLLLPSVSACLLAGLAFEAVSTTPLRRRVATVAVTAAVVVLFALFRARAAPWESGEVYFATSAALSPRSAKAQYDYGLWLMHDGQRPEAEAAFARALAILPSFTKAAFNLAESIGRHGKPGAGADVYLSYLSERPDDVHAIINATRLLLDAGRATEAVHWARRWVALDPGDRDAVDSLVLAEEAARRQEGAAVSP